MEPNLRFPSGGRIWIGPSDSGPSQLPYRQFGEYEKLTFSDASTRCVAPKFQEQHDCGSPGANL